MMYVTGAMNIVGGNAAGNTTETAILTSPVIDIGRDFSLITVDAVVCLTTGTATTFITPRIRRSADLTGPALGPQVAQTIIGAVGAVSLYSITIVDQGGPFGVAVYTLSAQATAATALFTWQWASMQITVQA